MKLTLKTLKGNVFTIEVADSLTVGGVKEQLEAERGEEFYASGLKLIHSGRILNDTQIISEAGIPESAFVVVMCGKPRAGGAPKPAAAATTAGAGSGTTATSSAPQAPTPMAVTSSSAPTAQPTTTSGGPTRMEEGIPTISPSEETVAQLVDMGFLRDDVIAALRAAYGNRDRAVEYLSTGELPAGFTSAPAPTSTTTTTTTTAPASTTTTTSAVQPPATATAPAPTAPTTSGPAVPGGFSIPADSPLNSLATNPQFTQLRTLVQTNPSLLPALLQGFGQRSPSFIQLISEHQEDFYNLLNMTDGEGPQGAPPPGVIQVHLTAAEQEAVERLVAMGFDRNRAIQAYLLCDKNESVAASFMLENNDQD